MTTATGRYYDFTETERPFIWITKSGHGSVGVVQNRDEFVEWVGRCVLPWEGDVRARLRRALVAPADIDDIVQEAYSRIAGLDDFRHIANPRSYFLKVAQNILFEQLRRSRIIRIDTFAEVDELSIPDDRPDHDRVLIGKEEVLRLKRLIEQLPERCRTMFVLRKIEGLSQRAIAQRLGVTENTVETQIGRGLRLILDAWADSASEDTRNVEKGRERNGRKRKRD